MAKTRFCKVFFCYVRGDRFCCADCRDRANCVNICLNWPSRCRLEDVRRRQKLQEKEEDL